MDAGPVMMMVVLNGLIACYCLKTFSALVTWWWWGWYWWFWTVLKLKITIVIVFLRIFCCSCHDPDRLSFEPLKAFLRPHSDANLISHALSSLLYHFGVTFDLFVKTEVFHICLCTSPPSIWFHPWYTSCALSCHLSWHKRNCSLCQSWPSRYFFSSTLSTSWQAVALKFPHVSM